jgi:pimeloyl-ACP methyl ester carboxylesterase
VIAIEFQGHGHTADIDRPLCYQQMADDTPALLKQLKVEQADAFGYSMGGAVGLALAIQHLNLVRRLVIEGSHFSSMLEAYDPEVVKQFNAISPDTFAPKELRDPYHEVAPDPKKMAGAGCQDQKVASEFKGSSREDMKSIRAQVLVTVGDRM